MDDSTADQVPQRSGVIRRGILFALLGIMMAALIYDYQFARASVNKAYAVLLDENQRLNARPEEYLNSADVQRLLGRTPAETFTDGSSYVEVYQWAGGIPGRPHSLFAVYKDRDDKKIFYRQAKFIYDSSSYVAPIPEVMIAEMGPDAEAKYMAMLEAERVAELEYLDPENFMARLDADGDGQLAGEEIPAHAFGGLDTIDTDADQIISMDELTVRVERRRQQLIANTPSYLADYGPADDADAAPETASAPADAAAQQK